MKVRNNVKHSVIDAIDSLMSVEVPDANAPQISNLLAASISQLVPRDQRALCAMFTHKEQCPTDVFRQLLIARVDGLEHLIANAPWMTTQHALEVVHFAGASDVTRALARRHDLNVEIKRTLRGLHDSAIDRALELRQVGPEDIPIVEPAEPAINLEVQQRVLSHAEYQEYLVHAGETRPIIMATALSDRFEIDFRRAIMVLETDDVRLIAALMRFIGLQQDMAEQLFTRLRWRRYPDRVQRAAFSKEFEALTFDGARAVLNSSRAEAAA